jgi:hypothetical protein
VRLQSEVARLRHAQSAAEAAAGATTAGLALDAAGRQALLDAAVAAKEKPIATVLQLERCAQGSCCVWLKQPGSKTIQRFFVVQLVRNCFCVVSEAATARYPEHLRC